MAITYIVSSNNFETTVAQRSKTTHNNIITHEKTDVNSTTNSVVRNWIEHKTTPTHPSEEVDAAFVWAGVFDHKLLQPLSGLVRNTDAFATALMGGFTHASISELMKCVPLDQIDDRNIFYIFRTSLQYGRKTLAKKMAHILVERDSNCLGAEFADFMSHSTDVMLRSADVMRAFKSPTIVRQRSTLLGLGIINDYPPFSKWYADAATILIDQPQRENIRNWDQDKIDVWVEHTRSQNEKTMLLKAVPKKRLQGKSRM